MNCESLQRQLKRCYRVYLSQLWPSQTRVRVAGSQRSVELSTLAFACILHVKPQRYSTDKIGPPAAVRLLLLGGAAQKSDFSGKVVGPSFLLICCSHEWELSPCKVGTKNFGALDTFRGQKLPIFFTVHAKYSCTLVLYA